MEDIRSDEQEEMSCLVEMKTMMREYHKEFEDLDWLLDDKFLLHFVRGKNYDAKNSVKVLRDYLNVRRREKGVLNYLKQSVTPRGISQGIHRYLKATDPDGRLIIFVDYGGWTESSGISVEEASASCLALLEYAWLHQAAEKNGVVWIVDMANFGWFHIKQTSVRVIKLFVNLLFETFPLRYQAIHVVNANSLFRLFYNVIRMFLPKKFKAKLVMHGPGNFQDLHKALSLSASTMPQQYGGNLTTEQSWLPFNSLENHLDSCQKTYERMFSQFFPSAEP